jgi:endogenous inhibitor of DNA gyrase (YacG/DUF329 family)
MMCKAQIHIACTNNWSSPESRERSIPFCSTICMDVWQRTQVSEEQAIPDEPQDQAIPQEAGRRSPLIPQRALRPGAPIITPNQTRRQGKTQDTPESIEKTEAYLAITGAKKRELLAIYEKSIEHKTKQKVRFTPRQTNVIFDKYINHHVGQLLMDIDTFSETVHGWETWELNELLPLHQQTITPPKQTPSTGADAHNRSTKASGGRGNK